jgi:hypothetical protein
MKATAILTIFAALASGCRESSACVTSPSTTRSGPSWASRPMGHGPSRRSAYTPASRCWAGFVAVCIAELVVGGILWRGQLTQLLTELGFAGFVLRLRLSAPCAPRQFFDLRVWRDRAIYPARFFAITSNEGLTSVDLVFSTIPTKSFTRDLSSKRDRIPSIKYTS